MMPTRDAGRWNPDRIAVALLAATFVVVTLLLGQALLTLRAHQRMVDSTLEDFATFAAERVAAELNSTFSSIFLDQIGSSRTAHYAWAAGEEIGESVPTGRWSVDTGAIPTHFSIGGDAVITRGATIGADLESWLLAAVGEHARDVYPAPAPYALLRSSDAGGTRAVAYRKEEAYEGVAVYGFLIRFDRFADVYRTVLQDAPVLPMSLVGTVEPTELMTVRFVFPQNDELVFVRPGPESSDVVVGEAIVAKAGRMAVRVELDAAAAKGLVPGGDPVTDVMLFTALAVLTVCLLGMSLGLQRRASRLARMREAFVANVSHDLRTPLAQIRMFAETLLLGRLTDAGERERSLEIIRRQAIDLSDLVDNVVHASERGSAPVRPTSTDLERLLAETKETLTPTAEAKRVTIDTRIEGDPRAMVDGAVVRRILVNLIDNAIKYGPRGQVVSVTLSTSKEGVDVVVEDRGPGVPRRERARVWERFTRLQHDDHTVTGAGIGLAVVRDLAERHGGTVSIGDAQGRGARVSVRLAGDLAS